MVVPLFTLGGALLLLMGMTFVLRSLDNLKRRSRIIATRTSTIAESRGTGVVAIKGRIVPTDKGLLKAPLSGRASVWARVTVLENQTSGKSSSWVKVVSETQGRPFMIDDGSGELARVLPNQANVVLDRTEIARSGTFNDAPPHLIQFLAQHGLKSTSWIGANKSMRYEEEVLAPGDPIYAIGPSLRAPGPPASDGYRVAPTTELVLSGSRDDASELILTNKSEQELTRNLLRGFVGGVAASVVGAIMCAVGFAILRH